MSGRDSSRSALPFPCSEDELAELAEAELDALPGWITRAIRQHNVAIGIEDELSGSPRTLGLFQVETLMGRSMATITLYRRPIVRAAGDREHLRRVVHDTLLHELGHLFGMSEDDLDHYSIGNDPLPDAAPVHPPPEPAPPSA